MKHREFLTACCVVLLCSSAGSAWADVRLPALVGDHMVLQRDSKIRIWGWADPGEAVRIAFQGKTFNTKADRAGDWSISLGPYPAGGPHEMSVRGKNSLVLHDILIGDVWLASGQSNMEMPMKSGPEWQGGIRNEEQEIAGANFPRIRLFAVKKTVAASLRQDVSTESWRAVTPDSVADFSAVAYLFGRELHARYAIPIGLIQSVWGGTVAEAWMSEASLQRFPELFAAAKTVSQAIDSQSDYFRYLQREADWYARHAQDRGRMEGRDIWADPNFDASAWPVATLPFQGESCAKEMKSFGGVVWFRRSINVPPEHAGKALHLHLGRWLKDDVTYFNGRRLGETYGYETARDYEVPGKTVLAGENALVVRLEGYRGVEGGCVGMYDDQMTAQIGDLTIPLAGTWSYQTGPDISDFPVVGADLELTRSLPNISTALFNGMIHPLAPFKIKGAIWYQGESNANRSAQYRTLFPALIQDWRRQWGYDLPFFFVQLAGFGPNKAEPAEYPWAELREAQSMALSLPLTGMATAIDIGDETDIHPKNKQDVAHRLALAAAKVAYGEKVVDSGPTYQSMRVEGNRIRIQFSSVGSGLLIKDEHGLARGFQIAGADGKYHWAQARQDGNDLLVSSEGVQQPVSVRYDWRNMTDGNVYNKEGLPALPFRTDK